MTMTIGALADAAGVGVQTIRFYEREGLIEAPARTRAGYRLYDANVTARLVFIRRAQELGFTLKEIRELMALEKADGADCTEVFEAASAKVAAIQQKIDDLARMQTALTGLIQSCDGSAPVARCPIMESLHAPAC